MLLKFRLYLGLYLFSGSGLLQTTPDLRLYPGSDLLFGPRRGPGNILALALMRNFPGKWFVRLLILLPWATPIAIGSRVGELKRMRDARA